MKKDTLHLKAPGNWMNDPNGFIYYRGKYHLFYQHFPYAPVWGTMHWGHAVSEDLVHWEHLDIALFPTKYYDRNGVFSGSALEKDGGLYLYYSAVRYLENDPENIHVSLPEQFETSQAMIVSKDGFHFDNWHDKKQIIPVIRDEEIGHPINTRDPKVWRENGNYYMILGSTCGGQAGRVLFYRSADGQNWEYASQYRHEGFGKIVECPDLFPLGDSHVFIGSPMCIGKPGEGYEHHSLCAAASFDAETCSLRLTGKLQYIDYGMDLYAPQTNLDKDGRRVLTAWMRMPEAVSPDGGKPWNGMMCLPRVIEMKRGHIYFRVHPSVEQYFSDEMTTAEYAAAVSSGLPLRIQTSLSEGESLEIGGYRIWVEDGTLKTDRSRVFGNITGPALTASVPENCRRHELDIFVEPNLIEIFTGGGKYVISHVVYDLGDWLSGKVTRIFRHISTPPAAAPFPSCSYN